MFMFLILPSLYQYNPLHVSSSLKGTNGERVESLHFFDDLSFAQRCCDHCSWSTVSFPSCFFSSLRIVHSSNDTHRFVYWFWQVPVSHNALNLRKMLVPVLHSLVVLMLLLFPWKNLQHNTPINIDNSPFQVKTS